MYLKRSFVAADFTEQQVQYAQNSCIAGLQMTSHGAKRVRFYLHSCIAVLPKAVRQVLENTRDTDMAEERQPLGTYNPHPFSVCRYDQPDSI